MLVNLRGFRRTIDYNADYSCDGSEIKSGDSYDPSRGVYHRCISSRWSRDCEELPEADGFLDWMRACACARALDVFSYTKAKNGLVVSITASLVADVPFHYPPRYHAPSLHIIARREHGSHNFTFFNIEGRL